MKKLGFVGYRGMVGQVLTKRMLDDGDFSKFETYLFSSSQQGKETPGHINTEKILDSNNLDELKVMDIILTCQGGDYTKEIYPVLRNDGWNGYWIDAASALRMDDDSCLVLDPLNNQLIDTKINEGVKTFVGANCTVSLLLMGLAGLINNYEVEWISSMSYQAISGSGAKAIEAFAGQVDEFSSQMKNKTALEIIDRSFSFTGEEIIGGKLAGGLLPWIDTHVENGQTREEWKASCEASKIINRKIAIDGTCVRVGSIRSHAQGLTIKLKEKHPIEKISQSIAAAHEWVEVVSNDPAETKLKLNPHYTSNSLKVTVGRLRYLNIGDGTYLNAFTIGDQLLWGAAEPLKRILNKL